MMIRSAVLAVTAALALTPMISGAHAQGGPELNATKNEAPAMSQPAQMGNGSPTGWWQDAGGRSVFPYKPGFAPMPAPPPRPTAF